MNVIYLCKITEQQAAGERVVMPKKVASDFFNVSNENIAQHQRSRITICHSRDLLSFVTIEVEPSQDNIFYWNTQLNAFLADNNDALTSGCLLLFEKLGRSFCVHTIKNDDAKYDALVSLFEENETNMLLSANINEQPNKKERSPLAFDKIHELMHQGDIEPYSPFITALRTKPFLLLAGISGTGKSQKVQELAFMTCPQGNLRVEGGTTPGNYCLIEVKPNWHDSTDLLGYYNSLSGKYELTDFIRFVYKAIQNDNIPFFLCLDEMNLAPVEQYFAEYLSVLETRTKDKVSGYIETEYLLSKEKFSNCELVKKVVIPREGYVIDDDPQFEEKPLYSPKDSEIIAYLKENGLTLPDNLFVIGTVNMDDTTYQFSRKVIDRAFTIEMNGGKMKEMFSENSKKLLQYRDAPVALDVFKSQFVKSFEVLEDERFSNYTRDIKEKIPVLLGESDGNADADSINGILNNTPFRVSYRVQNELVLYLSSLIINAGNNVNIDSLIKESTLAILLEKILPRVQGEQKQLETKKGDSNILKDLKQFVEQNLNPANEDNTNSLYNQVIRKLEEMDRKLNSYYTNFF